MLLAGDDTLDFAGERLFVGELNPLFVGEGLGLSKRLGG